MKCQITGHDIYILTIDSVKENWMPPLCVSSYMPLLSGSHLILKYYLTLNKNYQPSNDLTGDLCLLTSTNDGHNVLQPIY